jgi:hypothetical protein
MVEQKKLHLELAEQLWAWVSDQIAMDGLLQKG